jgi:N-acetyl-anhydromuramyl-L-alanine amidase AmpD
MTGMWPVATIRTTSTPFGTRCCGTTGRPHYWGGHIHKGIDIAGPIGTQIRAAWGGKVISANWGTAFGNHIVIDTDRLPDGSAGLWVMYAHLSKKLVSVGSRVEAGQIIGEMGVSGNVTGSHVHMEVQKSASWYPTNYVDPTKWLNAHYYWQDKKVYESKMVLNQKDSDSVRNVQSALNARGYYMPITGNYGTITQANVSAFQTNAGSAELDGIVGPHTAELLDLVWVDDVTVAPQPPLVEHTTLGSYLDSVGHRVMDVDTPYGRPETADWQGVKFIMLHHTATEDDGVESVLAESIRTSGPYPPNAQILLGGSGTVWLCSKQRQDQPEPGRASHAGVGKGFGIPDDSMNAVSIGVEVQADGTRPLSTYPSYTTLIKLLADLCKRYNLSSDKVIGHKEWSTSGKIDPLDNMDVVRLHVAIQLGEQIEPEEDMYVYHYTGKPSNGQSVGTEYVSVTNARWVPPVDGLLHAMVYLNCTFKLKTGKETGTIRVRAVREAYNGQPADVTAYQDFTVSRNGTKDGEYLITHTWFESAEGGRPIHWEVDRSVDFESVRLGTRYSKWALLPKG